MIKYLLTIIGVIRYIKSLELHIIIMISSHHLWIKFLYMSASTRKYAPIGRRKTLPHHTVVDMGL